MQKIIAIVGPTASGKTALSIALAKHFCGEIISADSMQIYREMQIGTAKPDMAERDGVLHHLMGHVSVEESYNVAEYTAAARRVLSGLEERKVLPIICGGTGLYISHLLEATDFFDIPIDQKVREHYQKYGDENGNEALYILLKKVDPELAAHLHPNDSKRIIRGLEVFETTGKKLSDFQKESRRETPYDVLYIGLNYRDRSLLYQRIDKRVDLMIENGLEQEVRSLLSAYTLSETSCAAIGYKELIDAIEGKTTISEGVELIKKKSRNYAKRQLSWFRRNEQILWFYPDQTDFDRILLESIQLIEDFLKGDN